MSHVLDLRIGHGAEYKERQGRSRDGEEWMGRTLAGNEQSFLPSLLLRISEVFAYVILHVP